MGAWVSRALIDRVNLEAGPREFPPEPANLDPKMANPSTLTVAHLHPGPGDVLGDLMQGMAALAAATGINPAKADIRRVYGLVDERVREARGMPPRQPRKRNWFGPITADIPPPLAGPDSETDASMPAANRKED